MSDLKLHSLKNMTPSHLTRPGILYILHHLSSFHTSTLSFTQRLDIQQDQATYTDFTICLHSIRPLCLLHNALTSNQTRKPIQSSPFFLAPYLHNAFSSDQTGDREHVLPAMLDYKGLLNCLNILHL